VLGVMGALLVMGVRVVEKVLLVEIHSRR
jgi:hypothetical protein